MTDPEVIGSELTPAEKRRVDRDVERMAARLKKGEEARKRRLENDPSFKRAVAVAVGMPKEVKLVYAELCAVSMPRELLFVVHKEITTGAYSAETLRKCVDVAKLSPALRKQCQAAIKLRESHKAARIPENAEWE